MASLATGHQNGHRNGVVNGDAQHRAWWKEASVYQIYPASFCDSTGNGIGDIPGIISKMDYVKALGVDVVWLSPIFASPQIDMGYDISDYRAIDPQYGSVEDVDRLMNGLHERGVKLLLDMVVNHTSDQHEWFKQSRSGKDNPYRDWYVWRKPKYDTEGRRQPPNNWVSHFEGKSTAPETAPYQHALLIRDNGINRLQEAFGSMIRPPMSTISIFSPRSSQI